MEIKNTMCFCTSIWVKDEEQVVGEEPVTLFIPAIGDDVKNMTEFITSLQLLDPDKECCRRMHFVCVLKLFWKEWEKLEMQQGFRWFSVVSTVLYQYWSQEESCKFWWVSVGQSFLGSAVKKTSYFLSVFLIRLSLSSCVCECHLICLPELVELVFRKQYLFHSNLTKRSNTGVFVWNWLQGFRALYFGLSSSLLLY